MRYPVNLSLYAAGPVRKRTKYKSHKMLWAERKITLPFVPYAGLYLLFEREQKRGLPRTVYLRVRCVEWAVESECFNCNVDEVLGSVTFSEWTEVRGEPRNEKLFIELQKSLESFGFDVRTDAAATLLAFHKSPDGSSMSLPP